MEEVKKEIKVGVTSKEEQKISYEQLTEIANQLHTQNRQLISRVNQLEIALNQTRLDYLFAVVKIGDKFPTTFVDNCTDEIMRVLSFVATDTESDNKKEE